MFDLNSLFLKNRPFHSIISHADAHSTNNIFTYFPDAALDISWSVKIYGTVARMVGSEDIVLVMYLFTRPSSNFVKISLMRVIPSHSYDHVT